MEGYIVSLQDRIDADHLRRIHQALRACARPELVRIIDTGVPGRIDRPRYRLEITDQAAPSAPVAGH